MMYQIASSEVDDQGYLVIKLLSGVAMPSETMMSLTQLFKPGRVISNIEFGADSPTLCGSIFPRPAQETHSRAIRTLKGKEATGDV